MIEYHSVEGLGLMAGTLTTFSFLPQVLRVWQTRSARDLSFPWIIIFTNGVFLWLLYGLAKNSPSVIIANAVTLALLLVILYFKLKYG
ncbi:MAG: SemiSWEET transporter [Cyanobacteriota bacterium ELA615]|jgi:MtN3 and saliva related transmembrane protein